MTAYYVSLTIPLLALAAQVGGIASVLIMDKEPPARSEPATVQVRFSPLTKPVFAGRAVEFSGKASGADKVAYEWDFGDGDHAAGAKCSHTFRAPGICRVSLTVTGGEKPVQKSALVRVHTTGTLDIPQVLLDTDAKNEQDDQHYLGYALFSQLDILGVNSTHHGGGQEAINYAEILHVIDLARQSGLPSRRAPMVFHGANQRLRAPASGRWDDTVPQATDASEAILATARGATPGRPVWVVPVGPATNPASAILLARKEGLDLRKRVRFLWLGGSDAAISGEFNGDNDPWSAYVMCRSGVETWVVPAPVGARVAINKTTEGDLYADNPLGRYLKSIVPAGDKALFDPCNLAAIIGEYLDLGWVKEEEPVTVGGPDEGYRWSRAGDSATVHVIREIDAPAMKRDIFETLKGRPKRLKS